MVFQQAANPALSAMTVLGVCFFLCLVGWLLARYFRRDRPYPFPSEGYVGAAVVLLSEALMFAKVEPVATYFTPLAWTGYIFWADAAVFSIRGKSLWKTGPWEFACLALCSIPLWLIFEAYNLRLSNWVYVGLPQHWLALYFGYAWAFATIWPAIFETAALLRALGVVQPPAIGGRTFPGIPPGENRSPAPGRAKRWVLFSGTLLLIVPLLLPTRIGAYLFGAVWLGFIFLLEPLNYWLGQESLWKDWERGEYSRLKALLVAGLICGLLWEFWNYWAPARWVYTVPILPQWRIFAMPLPGYLGFPPFAVECFVLFAFFGPLLDRLLQAAGSKVCLTGEGLKL